MAKITKVKSAYLERLNNAEYRTFMARYGNLLAGGGSDSESPDEISFDPNRPCWASPKKFVQLSPPISPY